jgi:hypothetical protein
MSPEQVQLRLRHYDLLRQLAAKAAEDLRNRQLTKDGCNCWACVLVRESDAMERDEKAAANA